MKKLALVSFLLFAVVAVPAMAQVTPTAPGSGVGSAPVGAPDTLGTSGGVSTASDLVTLILGLVNWFAWFVALVAVIFGLYAGVLFISGGGDEAKLEKAKKILIYAIVGIIVAILAFSIVAISKSIVGI